MKSVKITFFRDLNLTSKDGFGALLEFETGENKVVLRRDFESSFFYQLTEEMRKVAMQYDKDTYFSFLN